MKSNRAAALIWGATALVWASCTIYYGLHGAWVHASISGAMASLGFLAAYCTWAEDKPRRAVKIGNRIYKPIKGASAEGIQEWFDDAEKIAADPAFDVAENAIVELLGRYDIDMVYQVIDTIFAPRGIPSFRFKQYHFTRWPWAFESDVPGWAERTAPKAEADQ